MKRLTSVMILLFVVSLSGCVVRAYRVPTQAMAPTIEPDDAVMAERFSGLTSRQLERNEIVIFVSPPVPSEGNKRSEFVFRIIGLPRESVELKTGKVFINGHELNEPFVRKFSSDDFGPVTVPEKEYFLLGDNRVESWDSRFWKPAFIKRSDIHSVVFDIMKHYYKKN